MYYYSDSHHLDSLETPIIVVGNGEIPDLSAEFIDSFKTIFRINNYCQTLPTATGVSITHWIVNGGRRIENRDNGLDPIVPYPKRYLFEELIKRTEKRIGRKLCYLNWDIEELGFNRNFFPTTGFCICYNLILRGYDFKIIGFDFLETGHIDNPEHKHTKGHKELIQIEKEILSPYLI